MVLRQAQATGQLGHTCTACAAQKQANHDFSSTGIYLHVISSAKMLQKIDRQIHEYSSELNFLMSGLSTTSTLDNKEKNNKMIWFHDVCEYSELSKNDLFCRVDESLSMYDINQKQDVCMYIYDTILTYNEDSVGQELIEEYCADRNIKLLSTPSTLDNTRSITVRGSFSYSIAVDDLSRLYMENFDWIKSAQWKTVVLLVSNLLGDDHSARVSAIVFKYPQTWTERASGKTFRIKCIIKCFTSDKTNNLAFHEFNSLFQVTDWRHADGKIVAFFESDNLEFGFTQYTLDNKVRKNTVKIVHEWCQDQALNDDDLIEKVDTLLSGYDDTQKQDICKYMYRKFSDYNGTNGYRSDIKIINAYCKQNSIEYE